MQHEAQSLLVKSVLNERQSLKLGIVNFFLLIPFRNGPSADRVMGNELIEDEAVL